ncbi:MAG: class I SAM-dependent RNA methyltransferase [Planctomycetota bacterium]
MTLTLTLPGTLRITCAPAIGPYLATELVGLGVRVGTPTERDTWIDVEGTLLDAMRLNLHLRTAYAVMFLLAEFPCNSAEELFDRTNAIPWEEIVPADGYLTIASRVNHPSITNWTFANLRVKDAIVDRISEKLGSRPDSGPDRCGVVIQIFWEGPTCRIYLNTSGNKLADRGYRRIPHTAPMQETLAAAVMMATGYTGEQPLLNPMCGSGTLAIEAALIATGRAPGLLRADYGLLHTKLHDEEAWQSLRRDANKQRQKAAPAPIIATDIDPRAVEAATKNAKTAGVDHLISFAVCDFAESTIPEHPGIVLLNPEYGERVGEIPELEKTYDRIGDFFKKQCAGWTGYIFTGNKDLAKKVRLTASRRMPFWNAKIECRLLKYEMYQGTRRKPKDPA